MRKILVVNMNYMGDALLTTPALAALRRAHPDAQIDTVVGAGAAADVLIGNPDLNQIIARTARGSWGRMSQIYRLLRDRQYTDAIIMPPLPAFYTKPQSIGDIVDDTVARVLDFWDIDIAPDRRWPETR